MYSIIKDISVADWFGIVALAMVGIFAVYGLFIKQKKETHEEGDKADDRLISLLKGTVEALEKKVATLEGLQKINSQEIEELKTENEVMRKILQGKDIATLEYQKQGLQAMKDLKETLAFVSSNARSMDRLMTILTDHLEFVEKVMIEIKEINSNNFTKPKI